MNYTNSQSLLFDQTPFPFSFANLKNQADESFYEKGYIIVDAIESPEKAHAFMDEFISSIDPSRFSLYQQMLDRVQLAKVDQLPVCDALLDATYQSIHMDMGHPLYADGQTQNMFIFTGLYFPIDGEPSEGTTRVVTLKHLFAQKTWGGKEEVREKLVEYANRFGDGKPEYNTQRLACVARFIDAMQGEEALVDFRDQRTDEWFQNGEERNEAQSLKNEYDYYAQAGHDLKAVEERITLQPGQLLFFDNIRIGHGRLKPRKKAELFQFIYGVKDLNSEDIQAVQDYFVRLLAK